MSLSNIPIFEIKTSHIFNEINGQKKIYMLKCEKLYYCINCDNIKQNRNIIKKLLTIVLGDFYKERHNNTRNVIINWNLKIIDKNVYNEQSQVYFYINLPNLARQICQILPDIKK